MNKKNTSVASYFNEDIYKLYRNRVIIYTVFLAFNLIVCIILSCNIVKKIEVTPINYTDTGIVDYRVYLKENEFYEDQFLPKGKSYVTSLIDYIDINYNYVFNIDEITDMNFEYKVIGNLIIEDINNNKELLSKEYDILETQKKELHGSNEIVINEKFQINYEEYNQLANKFRSSYGIGTNSYLKLYLVMKKDTINDEVYSIHDKNNINEVIIPLSEKSIEIKIDSTNNKSTNQVTFNLKDKIRYSNIICSCILFLISLYFVKIIIKSYKKMKRRRSLYDKYIYKLLKEYDRLIVETNTLLDFKNYNIIQVSQFTELLDVRDNLKSPINYYCVEKHIKGIFYILADNNIYALFVSTETLEKDKN